MTTSHTFVGRTENRNKVGQRCKGIPRENKQIDRKKERKTKKENSLESKARVQTERGYDAESILAIGKCNNRKKFLQILGKVNSYQPANRESNGSTHTGLK